MKRLIIWLAKIFKANITVEKTVIKEVPVRVEVEKLVSLCGTIKDDVTVKGDLVVEGTLTVTGELTCFKKKGN